MHDTSAGRRTELFNDGWVFVPDAVDVDGDLASTGGESVTLPHTWNALDGQDGGNDYRRGPSTYLKQFTMDPGDNEVWMEFRGANSSADVYLNGTHLGRHDGGYSTFRYELTAALIEHNVVAVVVDNAPNSTTYPQRADFTFYGGMYRDVTLITANRCHFALDDHGGPGLVVTPTLEGSRAIVAFEASVTDGHEVQFAVDGVGTQTATVIDGSATATVVIDDVRRWHGARDPHLYRATARLMFAGETVDEVSLDFGCRGVRGGSGLRLPAQRGALSVAWSVAPSGLGGGRKRDHHRDDANGSRPDPGDRGDHRSSRALPTRPTLLRPVRRRRHRGLGRDPADHRLPPRRERPTPRLS